MQAASERSVFSQADAWNSAHEAASERSVVSQDDACSRAPDASAGTVTHAMKTYLEVQVEARNDWTMWEESAPAPA